MPFQRSFLPPTQPSKSQKRVITGRASERKRLRSTSRATSANGCLLCRAAAEPSAYGHWKGQENGSKQRQRQGQWQLGLEVGPKSVRSRRRLGRSLNWSRARHVGRSEGRALHHDAVVNRFMQRLRGATMEDLQWLLRMDDFYRHVYIYDHATQSTHHPSQSDPRVPGPMVWLLGRYNRMHMGVGRKPNGNHRRREQLYVLCVHPSPKPNRQRLIRNPPPFQRPESHRARSTYTGFVLKHGSSNIFFQKMDFLALDVKTQEITFF